MTASWEELFERAQTHELTLEEITDELERRRDDDV